MRQEHKVESLNKGINELQQQAYAQRLELEDAHHGNVESRLVISPTIFFEIPTVFFHHRRVSLVFFVKHMA